MGLKTEKIEEFNSKYSNKLNKYNLIKYLDFYTKYGHINKNLNSLYNKYNIKYSDCSKTETHVSFGLMTADELVFAGGLPLKKTQNIWYNLNGSNQSYRTLWWSMSPAVFDGVETHIYLVNGQTFEFGRQSTNLEAHIRPVISLDSCVNFLSGDGSPDAPYVIDPDSCS